MMQLLFSRSGCARLLCFLGNLLVTTGSHAALDILDGIDITRGQEQSTIHIRLNIPMGYKSHVPERSGDLLHIFVEPLPSLGADENALLGLQTIQWSPDEQVPLFDVTYDGGGFANTSITLRFQKDVEFELRNTGDLRSIDVAIKHVETSNVAIPGVPRPVLEGDAIAETPATNRAAGTAATGTVVHYDAESSAFPYCINLASSATPFQANALPDLEEFSIYRLYTAILDKGDKQWYRLRLGFFESVADANGVREHLLQYYPEAWVTKVPVAERIRSSESILAGSGPVNEAAITTASKQQSVGIVIPEERLDSLMQEARDSMTEKDYATAIRLYTKILQSLDNKYSQEALEYLGLARERNDQLAHAKMVYRDYLQRYPEGEDAVRVNQRLAGLVTAGKDPREKLQATQTRVPAEQKATWDLYGGFSQYYRRDQNTTGIDEAEITAVSQSSLNSNMDVTGRLLGGSYDLRTRFTGGYLHDFLDDGVNSDTSVSSLYFDASGTRNNLSLRIGRQSRSTGGVLGRFDGLLAGFPLGDRFAVSAVGGFPVQSSTESFDNTSQFFYGLTIEAEGFASGWDANTFVIQQQSDGITDRRAIGGEIRYFDPVRSFFSLVDYDIYFKELNIWQLLGNWTLPDKTTFNLVVDYRKSPILTANNALIGQNVISLDELQDSFSTSEIEDLARDRTATSKLATLGMSRPMNEHLQFSGDVTVLNLSDTSQSGGVEASEGTGTEYIYNLQLIGSNLINQGDITILGLRFADGDDRDVYSFNFNTRYPLTSNLRINPRFRMDSRKFRDDNTSQVIYRPSLRIDYQVKRRLRLEAEFGGEFSDREIIGGSGKDSSYFVSIGYRADF